MNALRLYGRYIATSIRSQRQYPASVIATSIGAFAATITDFVGIWALFARFRRLGGWGFGEVALLYGVVSVSFALADSLTRGFDVFGEQFVKTGDFDRLLVRPRSTVLQLLGYELRMTRIGRLAQGVLAWGVGAHLSHTGWSPASWAILAFAAAGGIALFSGILILQATLAFWTVESLEVANTLTYGGVEAGQYPLDVYARWFRDFLVYVVPIGCISYFPVSVVVGRVAPLPYALAPALGFAFLVAASGLWTVGVRHYTSTGS
jgi:viologen exporter family transport system permease protein